MKYTVKTTAQFRRDYRRAMRDGLDMGPLDGLIAALSEGETLPRESRDRPLGGRWAGHRACQVSPGRLLVYRMDEDCLVLTFIRTGSRTELFRPEGVNAMKKSTSLRMLLRSPVKTAVTLVLIAAASFLFLYNLLDYAMTRRNYGRTYASYHGYLSVLHPEDRLVGENDYEFSASNWFFLSDPAANPAWTGEMPYENSHLRSLTAAEVRELAALPGVTAVEKRYMTGGIADFPRLSTYNSNINYSFYVHTNRLVFTAVYDRDVQGKYEWSAASRLGGEERHLRLTDVELLAGNEALLEQSRMYIDDRGLIVGAAVLPDPEAIGDLLVRISNDGVHVFVCAYGRNGLSVEAADALVPGQRYVFVACADPNRSSATGIVKEESLLADRPYIWLGDDSLYGTCDIVTPLAGEPENWLETEKFAGLRKMMEIIETDRRTLDVHYMENMQSLKRYQEGKLVPVEGRLLTPQDTADRNPVCVLPADTAEALGLGVGDTLRLKLGDKLLEQYAPFGAVAYSPLRYADNWTEQEFTIVGTFAEVGLLRLSSEEQFWAYGENAVIVPLSFLPETADTENHEFKPGEVSFVIGDADSILPFRDEVLPRLEEAGLVTYFFDGNWPAVQEQLAQAGSLSMVKLLAFALSAMLVLWLTVYLYILRKKKEFAVMRALGCPAGRARGALLFPLLALALPAVALGSAGAVVYTHFAAERNAAEFAILGLSMDASIPPAAVLLGVGGSVLLLLLLAWAALGRVAARPPLELLQGEANRNVPKAASLPAEPAPERAEVRLPELPEPVYRPHTALRHTLDYVGRRLRRTPAKSLLSLLLALVLAFSIGFFTLLRSTYRELYQNIEIHPRFVNGFSYNTAKEVEKSGEVRDPYYEYVNPSCESNFVPDTLILTTDLSRETNAEITWREDKGPEFFSQTNSFCVISRDLADELGYTLGSRLEITARDKLTLLSQSYTGFTTEELLEIYHDSSHHITVAGIAEETGKRVYAGVAAWQSFKSMFADYVPLDIAEYTLLDYHRATAFRSYAWRLTSGSPARFSMETREADRIYQTYRLLELLYPIAFALALVLGGVLPAGVILQSAREASLLRVLGTTRRRTRAMLSIEQIALCVLGLGLAAAALWLARGSAVTAVAGLVLAYILSHLVSCAVCTEAAAVSVTNRNVLELLQVKE